jgi:hypothetical protein
MAVASVAAPLVDAAPGDHALRLLLWLLPPQELLCDCYSQGRYRGCNSLGRSCESVTAAPADAHMASAAKAALPVAAAPPLFAAPVAASPVAAASVAAASMAAAPSVTVTM